MRIAKYSNILKWFQLMYCLWNDSPRMAIFQMPRYLLRLPQGLRVAHPFGITISDSIIIHVLKKWESGKKNLEQIRHLARNFQKKKFLFSEFILLSLFIQYCELINWNYCKCLDIPTISCLIKLLTLAKADNFLFLIRRCPWCNGYCPRKWVWRHEFKSWTRLIAFSHSTNTLGKGMNPIILPPAMGK